MGGGGGDHWHWPVIFKCTATLSRSLQRQALQYSADSLVHPYGGLTKPLQIDIALENVTHKLPWKDGFNDNIDSHKHFDTC